MIENKFITSFYGYVCFEGKLQARQKGVEYGNN